MANIDAGLVRGPQGLQGIKGDPFTYADFTESQIAELQRPATEAATRADKATKDAQAAIAEVKATEAKLYPAAENVLKGTAKDTFVYVDDAFPSSLLGIEVEGACRQDGTPSPDSPVQIEVIEHPVVNVTGRNLLHYTDKAGKYNAQVGEKLDIPRKISPLVFNGEDAHTDAKYNAWTCGHLFATEPLPAGTYYVSFNLWSDTGAAAVSRYITSSDYVIINNLGNAKASGSGYTQSSPYRIVNSTCTVADGERLVVSVDINDLDISVGSVLHVTGATVCATQPTAYAPYVGTSQSFTLPAEHPYLAKLQDGTADEIMVDKDGNVELVARVGKALNAKIISAGRAGELDNTNGISIYGHLLDGVHKVSLTGTPKTGGAAYCDKLYSAKKGDENVTNAVFKPQSDVFVVNIAGAIDEQDAKEKFEALNATVYAPIKKEQHYQLGKIEMPKAQDSIVNVWTDAEVTPNTGIEYTRDVNIVVANLESAIASITQG